MKAPQKTSPPAPAIRVHHAEIQPAEHKRQVWAIVAPSTHTLADAMRPEYAGRRAEQMRVGDELEIRHAEMLWLHKTIVVAVDEVAKLVFTVPLPNYPLDLRKARPIGADLSHATVEETTGNGFQVVCEHVVLREGFSTRAKAAAWLAAKAQGLSDTQASEAAARAA